MDARSQAAAMRYEAETIRSGLQMFPLDFERELEAPRRERMNELYSQADALDPVDDLKDFYDRAFDIMQAAKHEAIRAGYGTPEWAEYEAAHVVFYNVAQTPWKTTRQEVAAFIAAHAGNAKLRLAA